MASFSYTVDTQPMAEEIRSVSRHVNVTTGAVVAMQVAVIEAENIAADYICENVNRGFYSLIRSQLSQKVARLQSEVDSQFMQLSLQKQSLLSIKNRMERDYNMITSRYVKLFNALNTNLKSRVFELDRPTMDFVEKELARIANRGKYLVATVPLTQLESLSDSQKIIASNVKLRGIQVINSMKRFIHEMNVQKLLTDQILINGGQMPPPGFFMIPVAVYETNTDRSGNKNMDLVLPAMPLNAIAKSAITNKIYAALNELNWKPAAMPDKGFKEVSDEFLKLVQQSSKGKRVNELSVKLFQSGKISIF